MARKLSRIFDKKLDSCRGKTVLLWQQIQWGSRRLPGKMQKENSNPSPDIHQYVGPYRLEKTLGKGQTGKNKLRIDFTNFYFPIFSYYRVFEFCRLA